MAERRPYEPPAVRDVERKAKPVWVSAGGFVALISYPNRRRTYRGPCWPTWIVLGPLPALLPGERSKPRATIGSGTVRVVSGTLELVVQSGELPPDLGPALQEAAHNLVWARA